MEIFLNNNKPGLQDKLAWFYNEYVAEDRAENRKELQRKIYKKLPGKFPGFDEIYSFRNNISHGVIDKSLANLEGAERLRIKAKEIVDMLFSIISKTGIDILRNITYEAAISSQNCPPEFYNFNYGKPDFESSS